MTDIPARPLQFGKFDDDPHQDLAFAVPGTDGYLINIWSGDGQFGFTPATEVAAGIENAVTVTWFATNLDSEPHSDLMAIQIIEGPALINTYINDGTATFAPPQTSELVDVGEPWNSVVLFDSGGDGRADLLAEPYAQSEFLYIVTNIGDGTFTDSGLTAPRAPDCSHTTSVPIPAFAAFTSGVVFIPGECDGVGTSSLTIVLSQVGGDIHVGQVSAHGSGPSSASVGDFDDDGELELLVWDRDLHTTGLYQGDFLGNFEFERTISLTDLCTSCTAPLENSSLKLGAGNLDGDSITDLVLSAADQLHFGSNPLSSTPSWLTSNEAPGSASQLAVVDLDGDGLDDVVLVSAAKQTTKVFANRP